MSFIYDVRKKSLNFGTLHQPRPLYPQIPNFILNTPHSWTSLTSIQNSSIQGSFEIFLENVNNDINMMT